jgi:hypothetical protein
MHHFVGSRNMLALRTRHAPSLLVHVVIALRSSSCHKDYTTFQSPQSLPYSSPCPAIPTVLSRAPPGADPIGSAHIAEVALAAMPPS